MKKTFNYFLATTVSNGVQSVVAFRTSLPLNAADVIACVQSWGRMRFGIHIEVYDILSVSYKQYSKFTTKIDW